MPSSGWVLDLRATEGWPGRRCTVCGLFADRAVPTRHPDLTMFVHLGDWLVHQGPTAPMPGGVQSLCPECCGGHRHRNTGVRIGGHGGTLDAPTPCRRCHATGRLPGIVVPV